MPITLNEREEKGGIQTDRREYENDGWMTSKQRGSKEGGEMVGWVGLIEHTVYVNLLEQKREVNTQQKREFGSKTTSQTTIDDFGETLTSLI